MPLLPSVGQSAQRHRQHFRRQVVDTDPWNHEKATVRHRKVQPSLTVGPAPADPVVPGRQHPCRRLEQQNRERAPVAVPDEPADGRPEGPRASQVVVAVHQRIPQGDILG